MSTLFSVIEKPFNFPLEDQVLFAKNAGFDGIDYIPTIQELFFPPKKILHITKKHEIRVNAIHIPLFLTIYCPQLLSKKIINLLNYFPDCHIFNFHLSGFLTPLGKDIHKLEKFMQLFKNNKIFVSCESNPDEYLIFKYYPKETYDPDLFANFCLEHGLPINLDTAHIASWNCNIITFFKKYQSNINLIHLSDMTPDRQHLPLGKGNLPLHDFFKELKSASFKGNVIFEISNFPRNSSNEYVLNELKRSLRMFGENLR